MNSDKFSIVVKAFLQSNDKRRNVSFLKNDYGNIEKETKAMNGIYVTSDDIVKNGKPKTNTIKNFYIIEGYDIKSDETIIWICK